MITGGVVNLVVFGVIGVVALGISAAVALPSLLAGWGLRKRRPWSRILALVVGALSLPSMPLGTALGIFAFVTLLRPEAAVELSGTAPPLE